jgi:hypothetical protein
VLITTIMVVNNNSVNRINLLTIIINTINTINHDWPILLTNINHEVLSAPLESSSAATSLMSRTRGTPHTWQTQTLKKAELRNQK